MGVCLSTPSEGVGTGLGRSSSRLDKLVHSSRGVDCKAYISERERSASSAVRRAARERNSTSSAAGSSSGGGSSSSSISSGSSSILGCAPRPAPSSHDLSLKTLLQVQSLQNSLAAVTESPGLGLAEAAELLATQLGVPFVSIRGFAQGGPRPSPALGPAVLLAAHGAGAKVAAGRPVDWDPASSCLRLRAESAERLHGSCAEGDDPELPPDWLALHQEAGLCSFLAVPVGPAAAPWGVLTVATEAPGGLRGRKWRVWPGAAAAALVHHLRHWQSEAVCSLLSEVAATEDTMALIGLVIRAARSFLARATNLCGEVRFAVVDGGQDRALVFEMAPSGAATQGAPLDSCPPACPSASNEPHLVALELPLSNTLLASAIALKKARFVRDCTAYMQSAAHPARDVFTQPSRLVSSLVVVPLLAEGGDAPLAALYLTLESPNDFSNIQAPLLGFINGVNPLLQQKLRGRVGEVWEEARAVKTQCTLLQAMRRMSRDGAQSVNGGSLQCDRQDAPFACAAAAPEAAAAGGPRGPSSDGWSSGGCSGAGGAPRSSELATLSRKRICTSSMLKVVEQDIQKCKRLSSEAAPQPAPLPLPFQPWDAPLQQGGGGGRLPDRRRAFGSGGSLSSLMALQPDLWLQEVVGTGGFGTVWRGTWKNVTAAIKVMYQRSTEQDAMRDAVEMAVLSAVCHPHVVQVFACLTDMVEATGESGAAVPAFAAARRACCSDSGGGSAMRRPAFRRLLPFEDPDDVETSNIVVMEYCDLGTLRQAASHGLFHRRAGHHAQRGAAAEAAAGPLPPPAGTMAVDLPGLLGVALEVAEAVSYLHSIRLCHCDIKMDNVLLKSDPSQPRGYITKLADFGLVKVMGPSDVAVNINGMGTVTHLAPELLVAGSRITTSVDVYSFGIFLYELYMGGAHAYQGLPRGVIADRVLRAGMRPRFPDGAPAPYAALASACWAPQPAARPSMGVVVASLKRMLNVSTAEAAAPEAAGPRRLEW